jgi:hypothetical protein
VQRLKPSTSRPGGEWQSGLMSALGHKRTYAAQQAMSALPPIATAKASAKGHVRFTPESRHVQCTSPCLLWAKRWGNRPALLWIAEDFGCCASG